MVVHTGHWGTGAFGGNKVLMTMLQLFAARLAGLDGLVYHTVDGAGSDTFAEGEQRLRAIAPTGTEQAVDDVLSAVRAMGFVWGVSDGN